MSSRQDLKVNVAIVGAGLSGGLLALALKAKRPALDVWLFDRQPTGQLVKTWSCHASDLKNHAWAQSLVTHQWPGYDVCFPKTRRHLAMPYRSLTPQTLETTLRRELGDRVRFDAEAIHMDSRTVELRDGTKIEADVVIDSTAQLKPDLRSCGFQKFVGCEIRFVKPHGLKEPILMDARVPQLDGFRFFYVLPLTDTVLLIEDTRFSETARMDNESLTRDVLAYAISQFGESEEVLKTESGVLPLPFAFEKRTSSLAAQIGMSAGFFHVVTGYSMPMALTLANALSELDVFDETTVHECVARELLAIDRERGYFHLLNKMMFRAAQPRERYRLFERFYRLSPALIERFYLGRLSLTDKARILMGRPPVPISRALRSLLFDSRAVDGLSQELGA